MNERSKRTGEEPRDGVISDRGLLRDFVDHNDEDAFAVLVSRYCGLVLGVCRRTLRDEHSAEDAFQATFFVLARRASKIRNRSSLAGWLYAVAHRTALRANAKRHQRREEPLGDDMTATDDTLAEVTSRYEQQLLDEELNRLPERLREPLVLRYLMGKSNKQIAGELGLTVSVVQGRLKRGKDRLRLCLVKRGIGVTAALAAVGTSTGMLEAATADSLVAATVPTAVALRSGAQPVGSYSQEALRLAQKELAVSTFRITATTSGVAAALVVAGLALAWAGNATQQTAAAGSPQVAATAPLDLPGELSIPDGSLPVQLAMAQGGDPPAGQTSGTSDPQEKWKSLTEEEAGQMTTRHLAALMMAAHEYAREHNNMLPPPTLPNPGLPPEKRLSGFVLLLPYLGRRPSNMKDERWDWFRLDDESVKIAREVYEGIDLTKAWDDPANLNAAKTILPTFLAPGGGPSRDKDGYATSHFAFVRGAEGVDNGAFPLEGRLSRADLKDGTVGKLALGQIHSHLGPWIAAGPATSRHVYHPSDRSDAPSFGSPYEGGCYLADLSASAYFRDMARTAPESLRLMTDREALYTRNQPSASREFREVRTKHCYATAAEWRAAREVSKQRHGEP
ncbi:MAG: RNA polymerase sigma factor [Planctomycetota bacterium]|jgi:RNA polymerase sigma factor (sigma-70 family)